MNTSIPSPRLLGAALLLAAGLSACSTGTESGDTNVERGTSKIARNPNGLHPTNVDSTLAQQDTATSAQERLYNNARNRKDRDNDGKAD